MGEIVEKLNTTWVDTKKAIGAATKVFESGEAVESPSKRLSDSVEALGSLLEFVETIQGDLGWTLKFKKDKATKGQLNLTVAQGIQKRCAEALTDLLEACKACKALLPKKEYSE